MLLSQLGFVIRLLRDTPKLTQSEAEKALRVLRRGSPEEMEEFARKARNLRRVRTGLRSPRQAAAAAIGAGIATKWALDDDEEE